MTEGAYPSISLHNVAETVPAEWADGGDRLCRVPESVGAEVNDEAQHRLRHATHSEVRFVPDSDDEEIEVTLSAAERTEVRVFWGSFQPWQAREIDATPETLTLSVPERLRELDDGVDTGRFDPRVCRIVFGRFVPVAVHDVAGDCRPPEPAELPDRRLLTYGTSITEGAKATAPHLSYVSHLARTGGYDPINFACSGSAHCDPALADYLAGRADWDVGLFAISVNMTGGGFTPAEFRERADYFVNTVADAHPEKPIVCVTLYPYYADVTESGDAEEAAAFREALRSVVEESPYDTLTLVEGPDLLDPADLTWDVLHPGDNGMRTIGEELARHLESVTE